MDLKIVEERKNPLLKRTEYRFEMSHPTASTPKRDEVRQVLATQLKVPKERIVVERMHAKFGTPMSVGEAAAYATKEAALATEREHILIRNGLKEKSVPAAPGAEAEKPAEPTKPEAVTEPAKPEKPAKAEKAEKGEKPEKADAPAEPPKVDKHPKAGKSDKAEKTEKPAAKGA